MRPVPDVTRADVAFGKIDHMPRYEDVPDEFCRRGGTPFNDAVSHWFFSGAKSIPNGVEIGGKQFIAKDGVEAGKALAAIRAILGSWEPKHENKEAACAYLLSEWFELRGSEGPDV